MEEQQYLDLVKNIIDNGTRKVGRNGAVTYSIFGHTSRYSLRNGTLPLLTTKKVFTRGIIEELLWFLRGSTNANELKEKNIHIWDGHTSKEHYESCGLDYEEGDLGPCFPKDTKVLTDSGYKNIQDITYDDKLYSHTGTYQPIEKVMNREYNGEMVVLNMKYSSEPVYCTPEHPFYVREYKKVRSGIHQGRKQDIVCRPPVFLEAKHIKKDKHLVGMKVNTKSIMPTFTYSKYVNQHVPREIVTKDSFSKDEYFMFGYFIGDGWIIDSEKRIYFVFNEKQEEYLSERIGRVLNIQRSEKGVGCVKYKVRDELYFNILKTFGKYAHGKIVPEWVHDSPVELVQEFLDGYFYADGYYCSKTDRLRATTVSNDISLSIQRLFLKIGKFCSITKSKREGTKKVILNNKESILRDCYFMEVKMKNCIRRSNWSFIDGEYCWFSIQDKKVIDYIGTVYNFTVANDNTYTVENKSVHNCYGFQWRHYGAEYQGMKENYNGKGFDQIANVVEELKNNPHSRRHVVCAWNPTDIPSMVLPPCHCLFQFYVDDEGLSCQLYQRSGDVGLGVPFNITSYSILTHLIAKEVGIPTKEFIHVIGDAHIYEPHIEALKEQITREPFPFPTLEIEDKDSLAVENFKIKNYKCHPTIKMNIVV